MKTPNFKLALRKGPVGFSLAVAAAVLLMAGIVADNLSNNVVMESYAATLESADIRADYIAESGLATTFAYLSRMSQVEPDFDRALDPNLDTTCSYTANSGEVSYTAASDDHAPPLPGGAVSSEPGNTFIKVPYGGGAYYVRIDDNSDDGHEGWRCGSTCAAVTCPGVSAAGSWMVASGSNYQYCWTQRNNYFPAATNNRETSCTASSLLGTGTTAPCWPGDPAATRCPEGASEEINRFRDNQSRDRDRTVIITVVGIYPGTDWATARGRRSYRMLVAPARQAPAIAAQGNVSMGSGTDVCGATGGIHSNASVSIGSSSCQCGDVSAVGTVGTTTACTTPSPCATCVPAAPQPNSDPLPIPPLVSTRTTTGNQVSVWDATNMNRFVRDAANQCYFFMGKNGVGYFWDHTRATPATGPHAGQVCSNFDSDLTPEPCGTAAGASLDVDTGVTEVYANDHPWCHCWVPVFFGEDNGAWPPTGSDRRQAANPYDMYSANGGLTMYPSATPRALGYAVNATPYLAYTPDYCPGNPRCNKGGADGCGGTDPDAVGSGAATCTNLNTDSYDRRWYPSNTRLYNFAALCGGYTPPTRDFFEYNSGGGVKWRIDGGGGGLTKDQVIKGLYFFDGDNGDQVRFEAALAASGSANVVADYAKIGIVTPMQVRITTASNTKLAPPDWARNYLVVSSSDANTLTDSSSCYFDSNGSIRGGILCRGTVSMSSNNALTGNIVSTNGNVTVASNVTITMDPGLQSWMEIPVRPWVWTDSAF